MRLLSRYHIGRNLSTQKNENKKRILTNRVPKITNYRNFNYIKRYLKQNKIHALERNSWTIQLVLL